jgi:hypothetical protein
MARGIRHDRHRDFGHVARIDEAGLAAAGGNEDLVIGRDVDRMGGDVATHVLREEAGAQDRVRNAAGGDRAFDRVMRHHRRLVGTGHER